MSEGELIQVVLYIGLLIGITPILGSYMARVFEDQPHLLRPLLRPIELIIYRFSGVDPRNEMNWRTYTVALIAFNLLGFAAVFLLQVLQSSLPLNPSNLPNVGIPSAFNTATSFMTNTNWQGYAGEVTMSYLTQMLGLTVQNFVSAATGIAVAIALTRGLACQTTSTVGNFWADLVRTTLYVLLPISMVSALILVSQGVPQTFNAPVNVVTLEGAKQTITLGPVASQIAIKQLGSNGGGYYNANSSHPLENPTPLSNFLEMFFILMIAAALTYTYGKMVGSQRQGWAIFTAMLLMFIAGLTIALFAEYSANPALNGISGVMEGKETRFGIANSVLWMTATTSASNGSVNAMHSSMNPLTGMIAMINMKLGEVIFGGVGAGLYGMLVFAILTVFIAGLMVGRTPEYLGKKVERLEIQMAALAILIPNLAVLLFAGLAAAVEPGLSSLANNGPHGLSEILYAFASASNNNGSAFAGLNANTDFYNLFLGIAMWMGRFGVIIPVMAIAGSMVKKRCIPPSSGTFPTDRPLFVGLLIAVVLIVGALTYFPALSLGPIIEQLSMQAGRVF